MRRTVLLILALLMSALPARSDDLQRIIDSGAIKAGICLRAEPLGFFDSEGNPRGYDVDVATLLAQALGVNLEIVGVTAATRITDLSADRIDVIVCNLTATAERARTIDFSFPYLRTGIKLLVHRNSNIRSLDDMGPSTRLIVGRGTTNEALALRRAPEAKLVYADSPGDAILQLRQDQADGYLEDSVIADYVARAYPDQFQTLPDTYSFDAISFGIRKGNPEFLRWLDLFASTYVSSGKYDEIYGKWWSGPPPPLNPIW
jgi:ABC-type amino acid transport substrate-binding protein